MRREGYRWAYAARLNGFRADARLAGLNRVTAADLIGVAAAVPGIAAVDVNYPDHLLGWSAGELRGRLSDLGLGLNGFAVRYYSEPGFRLGALGHPEEGVRRRAIDLTRRGVDALREAGGRLMTLWLGQDGWDLPFQADHGRLWERVRDALREVCAHDPSVDVCVEYKPDEPRAQALLPDAATTLLMLDEVGAGNTGVALDFCHQLYARESPARAAMLVGRRSRLLGVHLNDGYGRRDDGLVAGSVHVPETLELLLALVGMGYGNAIYFDTFPDSTGLDPSAECAANVSAVEGMMRAVDRLRADPGLAAARVAHDGVGATGAVQRALWG